MIHAIPSSKTNHEETKMENSVKHGNYLQFFLMIITSMLVMYVLSYANSWEIFGHAWFSETRVFMVLMMGGSMAIIMLTFMLGMYRNAKVNAAIYIGSFIVIAAALTLVRTQQTVGDVDFMEGMIPHHSIAVLTSSRAQIEDPRVRELADTIIRSQKREIKEMSWLIGDIRANGLAQDQQQADSRRVPEFSGDE
jgi:cadmium resistance protein CadD (predicted permease)